MRQPVPEGAVGEISGKEGLKFTGKDILNGTGKKGHVIVVRSDGPKGGPGMRASPHHCAVAVLPA